MFRMQVVSTENLETTYYLLGWQYLRIEIRKTTFRKLVNTEYGVKIWKLHIRFGFY